MGLGRKSTFAGVTSNTDFMGYLMDQVIQTFASAAARNAAIAVPYDGQLTYQTDTKELTLYNGTAWVDFGSAASWKSYTPTLTNITLGNGTVTGEYFRIGKTVVANIDIRFGSTSAMGTNPSITLPFPYASGREVDTALGLVFDASTGARHYVAAAANGGSSFAPLWLSVAGVSLVAGGNFTPTAPLSPWAVSDAIVYSITYQG